MNKEYLPKWLHEDKEKKKKKSIWKHQYGNLKNSLLKFRKNTHKILTKGMSTVHKAPPSLQFICNAIFCVTLRSFSGFRIVRVWITWNGLTYCLMYQFLVNPNMNEGLFWKETLLRQYGRKYCLSILSWQSHVISSS